jgi:hypothetical protein
MSTIIKLTYTQTGRTTLVNLEQVTTAFRIFEKTTQKYATRVNFQNDSFSIVNEDLQTIKELGEKALSGEYQSNDWSEEDAGGGEDLHDRLREDYNNNMGGGYQQRPYQNQRRGNYNNNYNTNQRW